MRKRKQVPFSHQYGPWAVIAGASEGLGEAFAREAAARGVNLVLAARRAERLERLAGELAGSAGVEARVLALDLSAPGAAARIEAETGGIEVGLLVYNAAFSAVGPFESRPLEHHLREIDTNIRAPCELAYRLGGRMLARGRGGIVLMSSLSSLQGSALISNYAATKAYNHLLGEGLWEEWRGRGVDVLACQAGATATPNYLASRPKQGGWFAAPVMPPAKVARAALDALGQQPRVIPGGPNRLAAVLMGRLLPRRLAVAIMGRILRGMYGL